MEANTDRLMHTIGAVAIGAIVIGAVQIFAPELLETIVTKFTGFLSGVSL